jgi:hypothetical protein
MFGGLTVCRSVDQFFSDRVELGVGLLAPGSQDVECCRTVNPLNAMTIPFACSMRYLWAYTRSIASEAASWDSMRRL